MEAGVITKTLKDYVEDKGFYLPLTFGAEGSSQIGGNVATNLGGAHVLKYGNIRNMVLSLEVITGRGEILNLGKGLVKNNTGYNLKDLFIGSEGTLGFISKVELSLSVRPKDPQVFLMTASQKQDVLEIFKKFKKRTKPLAFEFFTNKAVDYVLSHGNVSFPLEKRWPYYMLLELESQDQEVALKIFEENYETLIKEAILSQNETQAKGIWALRENISEALSSKKPYKNDISVRLKRMPEFLKELDEFFNKNYPDFEQVVFGHLGDGNLHINILKPDHLSEKDLSKNVKRPILNFLKL